MFFQFGLGFLLLLFLFFALPRHIEPLAGAVIPQGVEGSDKRREGKLWDRTVI